MSTDEFTQLADANVKSILWMDGILQLNQAEQVYLHTGDIQHFYKDIITNLMEITHSQYGALASFDKNGDFTDFITSGITDEQKKRLGHLPTGAGLLGKLFHAEKSLIINDIRHHPEFTFFPADHPAMSTLMGAPLKVAGEVSGAIYLANKDQGKTPYLIEDQLILDIFSKEIEHLLERNKLMETLKSKQDKLEQEKKDQDQLILKLQQAQEQLLQSEKMASIGQLAAGVAHEINNPVGYINSNLHTLKKYLNGLFELLNSYDKLDHIHSNSTLLLTIKQLKSDIDYQYLRTDLHQLIDETLEGVMRVKNIVQDLKDFSHVTDTEWEWTDIHIGLESTLNIVRNEIKYKAEVIKEYGLMPEIECIASQLNQVFMNILINAAHAITDKGTITISTGTQQHKVWIKIKDTGTGIKKEYLNKIFDPFFTTKPVGKGTGLGLSLSYSIVQKHHGHIEINSELGVGSEFTIWLPISQSHSKEAA